MRLTALMFLTAFPAALHAETIEAASRVTGVTLYPWGATVVRRIAFDAAPGLHQLIVPDLPLDTPAGALRVAAPVGVTIGAVNLATGRLPAVEAPVAPEIKAAEDEVERLENVLRGRDAAIAAIRLRVDAANEQWAFLRSLGQGKAAEAVAAWEPGRVRDLTRVIGEETLAARQAAHDAEEEAKATERAKQDDIDAVEKARQHLAALRAEDAEHAVLTLAVETLGGPAVLDVTTYTSNASWRPVYDLRLDRSGMPALAVERGILIAQSSGEDWTGVELVLSTARPAEQSAPSEVYPWLRRIVSEDARLRREAPAASITGYGGLADLAAPAPVMEEAAIEMQGATVTYRYKGTADIRDGVEELRLLLDTLQLSPTVRAVAVPMQDASAFLVAEVTNHSAELILPGEAYLYLDGAFVGQGHLPLVAAGDTTDLGFGPIDGIRLTRTVPERSAGERGILRTSNRLEEAAVLTVENLTGEAWPVRVIDRVPYSEQDDLEITYTATPPVTEADLDGQRGVLSWEVDLAAGATREIRIEQRLSWPEGQVLE